MNVINTAHRTHPTDNNQFLDQLISKITEVTGRIYGQSTYDHLIQQHLVPLTRSGPSAPTIQKAIELYREAIQERLTLVAQSPLSHLVNEPRRS